MVKLYESGAYLVNGKEIVPEAEAAKVEALTASWRHTTHPETWKT